MMLSCYNFTILGKCNRSERDTCYTIYNMLYEFHETCVVFQLLYDIYFFGGNICLLQ